jgi:cytochrome c
VVAAQAIWPETFGFGREATPEEIIVWDFDVRPDGTGLPEGKGTVAEGKVLYQQLCAVCHGTTGVEGPHRALVGFFENGEWPIAADPRVPRSIGSYWPYPTTVFDYTYRAMPQSMPGSLTFDQVYSLSAYMFYLNKIIPEDAEMNQETLPKVEMPGLKRFVPDDRLEHTTVR